MQKGQRSHSSARTSALLAIVRKRKLDRRAIQGSLSDHEEYPEDLFVAEYSATPAGTRRRERRAKGAGDADQQISHEFASVPLARVRCPSHPPSSSCRPRRRRRRRRTSSSTWLVAFPNVCSAQSPSSRQSHPPPSRSSRHARPLWPSLQSPEQSSTPNSGLRCNLYPPPRSQLSPTVSVLPQWSPAKKTSVRLAHTRVTSRSTGSTMLARSEYQRTTSSSQR